MKEPFSAFGSRSAFGKKKPKPPAPPAPPSQVLVEELVRKGANLRSEAVVLEKAVRTGDHETVHRVLGLMDDRADIAAAAGDRETADNTRQGRIVLATAAGIPLAPAVVVTGTVRQPRAEGGSVRPILRGEPVAGLGSTLADPAATPAIQVLERQPTSAATPEAPAGRGWDLTRSVSGKAVAPSARGLERRPPALQLAGAGPRVLVRRTAQVGPGISPRAGNHGGASSELAFGERPVSTVPDSVQLSAKPDLDRHGDAKQLWGPWNLWGLEYNRPIAPRRPGVGQTDPVLGAIIDRYGETNGVDTHIILPAGELLTGTDQYLYQLDGRDIQYVLGNRGVPYADQANREAMPFENIVLHHTNANRSFGRYITISHEESNDYVGYHFYINLDGTIVQAAPMTVRVNGAGGYQDDVFRNANSIHISLYGDGTQHTPEQIAAMTALVDSLQQDYGIADDRVTTHGFIQADRPAEQENLALIQVMNNVGAPVPLLTVNDGVTRDGRAEPDPQVELLQRFLKLQPGTAGGAVDGVFREVTQAAIAEFQRQNGLTVTGYIDAPTYRLMAEMALERFRPGLLPRP